MTTVLVFFFRAFGEGVSSALSDRWANVLRVNIEHTRTTATIEHHRSEVTVDEGRLE